MNYARIVDGGYVYETFVPPDGMTPQQLFHPDIPGQWVQCGDEVQSTWTYSEAGGFKPPVPVLETPEATKRQLVQLLGLNVVPAVDKMLADIPDEAQRERLQIEWRYPGPYGFKHDDELISAMDKAGLLASKKGDKSVEDVFWQAAKLR